MNPVQRAALAPLFATAVLCALAGAAQAQIQVTEPWTRATVAQQKATGMFLTLTAAQGGRLVSAASPLAEVVEIHEMAMEGNIMRMRAVQGLDLPAGKPITLKPGGYHIMLMGLRQQIQPGQPVPATLVIEERDGKRQSVQVNAIARELATPSGSGHGASGTHRH